MFVGSLLPIGEKTRGPLLETLKLKLSVNMSFIEHIKRFKRTRCFKAEETKLNRVFSIILSNAFSTVNRIFQCRRLF